jgi:hypothetical protein
VKWPGAGGLAYWLSNTNHPPLTHIELIGERFKSTTSSILAEPEEEQDAGRILPQFGGAEERDANPGHTFRGLIKCKKNVVRPSLNGDQKSC